MVSWSYVKRFSSHLAGGLCLNAASEFVFFVEGSDHPPATRRPRHLTLFSSNLGLQTFLYLGYGDTSIGS